MKTVFLLSWIYGVATLSVCAGETTLPSLRSEYRGPDGLPSLRVYEQMHGIAPIPGSEQWSWQVYFKFVFAAQANSATDAPIDWDCFLVRQHRYRARYRVKPFWDGRITNDKQGISFAAFTNQCEKQVGHVNSTGLVEVHSERNDKDVQAIANRKILLNPFTGQLWEQDPGGEIKRRDEFYLPWKVNHPGGQWIRPKLELKRGEQGGYSLFGHHAGTQREIAFCDAKDLQGATIAAGYEPQVSPGCRLANDGKTKVIFVQGRFANGVVANHRSLMTNQDLDAITREPMDPVKIDGRFEDWRCVPGVSDARGDYVQYLSYNPDTDLLEFKVRHDDEHLYFYTRVAGRHGNTKGQNDRYYFYVYIDVDQNRKTGYVPTRDDNCYFGVALGDDCESQFEFADGRFVKTFFGFAGGGGEDDVLNRRLKLAPSWYRRTDRGGNRRSGYKVEYVRRAGKIEITEDYRPGTSDDIIMALSADGSECEMRTKLSGFLQRESGEPILAQGQRIDLAVGVEAAGKIRNLKTWSADSTAVLSDYYLD